MWNFGSLAGITLVIMIVTGIVLSMHYTAHVDYAFDSVERIMRDVNPWMVDTLYTHERSKFLFHCDLYSYLSRTHYGSYKASRELLWILGVLILLLMMATAFMGYVLSLGTNEFLGCDSYYKSV